MKSGDWTAFHSQPNIWEHSESLHCGILAERGRKNAPLEIGASVKQISLPHEKRGRKEIMPIQSGDAYWLLHKFSKSEYPEGGEVIFTFPKYDNDSVWAKPRVLLQLGDLCEHLMLDHHNEVVDIAFEDRVTPGCSGALRVALHFLRPGFVEKKTQKRAANSASIRKRRKATVVCYKHLIFTFLLSKNLI